MILASQSPRRQELLRRAGVTFRVMPSSFDEAPLKARALEPDELVVALARGKARAVADAIDGDEPVIGADTVVALEGEVLGKPTSPADATRMLRELSGRRHTVFTGVHVEAGARSFSFFEATDVQFFPLDEEEIAAYVATGEPMDKAGAYGIQGRGCLLVSGIHGDYCNVVGLPVARLVRALRAQGLLDA